jgi:photosystem II stability/assembly factor-like uncharacterized protein
MCTVTLFSQWESIGPYGGYIRCLTKDNQGRVLSGNAYGGIFRTSDAGKNWEQLFTGYRNEDVRSLAVNSNNHIFAGTDSHGLYRSTNNGVSWERLINLVSNRTILDIFIKSDGDIFLATFDGVYRSTDNGVTFSTASNGITTTSIYSLGLSGGYLFAGTGNAGIFRSGDDGANWEAVNNGINLSDGIVWGFASAEETENVGVAEIHALTQNNLYHSTNSGVNWDELSLPTGLYLDVLLKNNSNIVVTGDKILNSTDQGNSWNIYNSPTGALISSAIEINDNTLMIGTQGPGNYVSTNNGIDWNLEVNKMPATAITEISATAGVINVSTRQSGIFSTSDGGLNWFNLSAAIPNGWFYGLYQHPTTNTLFALHQNGVYRSIDGGADWNLISAFGKTMEFNSLGNIFLGSGSYISKSTDDGVSFQLKLIDPNVFNSRQIAIDQNDEMYIATANDNGFQGQGVYRSTDLGETYSPYNVGLPNDITSVEYVDTNGFYSNLECLRELIAADANGNFYSNNDDGSWNQFNIGFQQGGLVKDIAAVNYRTVMIIPTITEREMATITITIDDPPTCLFEEETDIPDDERWAVLFGTSLRFGDINSEYIYFAGTIGSGVLRKVVITSIENIENNFPSKFVMEQNYPNPFNPVTIIHYSIPQQSSVTLKVYDVLGNEIATLVDEYKPAGSYEVDFNANKLSSGVYFYKLQAGSFVETKKMILLR